MLMGLALFAAGAGAAVLVQPPGLVSVVLVLFGLAAWLVGACAMVGYVRWFIASEIRQAQQDREMDERKPK